MSLGYQPVKSQSIRLRYVVLLISAFLLGGNNEMARGKEGEGTTFKIEDFSPNEGRYSIQAGMGYRTSDTQGASFSTVTLPLGHDVALQIPEIGLRESKEDVMFFRVGGRYAISDRLNIHVSTKADVRRQAVKVNGEWEERHDSGWRQINAGVDYRLTAPYQQPYVVGFADVAVIEREREGMSFGESAIVGVSSHWAYDPAILSITGTYSNFSREEVEGGRHGLEEVVGAAMSFGLAINPEINFRVGMSHAFGVRDRKDRGDTPWSSSSALNFGYTHRLSKEWMMTVTAEAGVAGNDSAATYMGLTWKE